MAGTFHEDEIVFSSATFRAQVCFHSHLLTYQSISLDPFGPITPPSPLICLECLDPNGLIITKKKCMMYAQISNHAFRSRLLLNIEKSRCSLPRFYFKNNKYRIQKHL